MSEVVVERCDPRERADGIRELFARNDSPQFDAVFERAYRPRAERGLTSWVGVQDGRVVMHISVSPQAFGHGEASRLGGFLGDLMVDAELRDFWAPARLLRTMVSDVRADGEIDFLLTTTIPDAEGVFKAGGFKPMDELQRYVLPLNRPYLLYRRLKARARRLRVRPLEEAPGKLTDTLAPASSGGLWRTTPGVGYYQTRMPTAEHARPHWLETGNGERSGTVLLTGHSRAPECNLADAFWGEGSRLTDVLLATADWARGQGYPKMVVSTFSRSGAARELERAGFFPRSVRSTVLMRRFGDRELPPLEQWFLPAFPMSNW